MVRGAAMCLLMVAGVANTAPAPAAMPSAAALAARVDHHYNALRSLRVEFVQQYDGMGMHRRESGTLLLRKPGCMRWTYAQPAGKLFILDGQDGYFYSPRESEVQRIPAKKLDDLRSPLRFLLGHTQLAKELLNLKIAPSASSGAALAAGDFELSGTPRGMEQRIASFKLTVASDGVIHAMEVEETDGAITRFSFAGEQPNAPAADSDFVFKAPPGTTVVNGLPPV